MDEHEVIALLLDDDADYDAPTDELVQRARCLTRDANGHMTLHTVESAEEFDRTARTTGCFRRVKEILDPKSREVIGYELEAVPLKVANGDG